MGQFLGDKEPDNGTQGGNVERVLLDSCSPWWGEHRCRYLFAAPHAQGARVLEIACGTGFGAEMLVEAGASCVVGVDLDPETVGTAHRLYNGPKRSFSVADGTRLPFSDGTFNLITSFETLEHVPEAEAFLAELHRVLTPDGLLVLSTPNRSYTEMNGQKCDNPFHVREYTGAELQELLLRSFSKVELFGQRLSEKYRISPFAADHLRMQFSNWTRVLLFLWKIQNKLPFQVKDGLSRLLTGHPFYPQEEHYRFTQEQIETAPVLLAVCHY